MQKIENYRKALPQLEQAVASYTAAPEDDLYRDGLIQRFEFTVELAWKSLKEYLEDQGMIVGLASPKGVLKEAFAAGIIKETGWNDILTARNLTSHVYDEETAKRIAQQICNDFMSPLRDLLQFYGT